MVQVGQYKQQKYEEGVTKIQAQIDQVAGLDLIKDVDKNYLQSKLDELGNNLRTVAGGDFSNFQLVNSVGGMTKQVANDKTVQNAVSSTAWYRKQTQQIEEARKKGKSDKNNEDFFQNGASKWLNDGVAGSSFSDSFVEYTDIMKTIRENITAAGIDSKYLEQVYETDERGNLLRDKDNHLIPARVMATETLDTNAEKVKAIVSNVLSQGNVQQQISIDGWANTRNVPVQSVFDTFKNDFAVRDAQTGQDLLTLQTNLDATNLSTEQRDALIQQQTSIKQAQEADRKKILALREKAISDPEQFKIDYYQDSYVNNLLSGFTTTKSKKEMKDSPLTKVLQWEENMNFLRSNENFDRQMQRASAARDARRLRLDELKFSADYEFDPLTGTYKKVDITAGKKNDAINTTTTSEINAENKGAEIDAENNYRNVTLDLQTDARAKGFDLIYNYLYKVNNGKTKDGKPFTKADAQKAVETYSKANGESEYQFIMRFSVDLKNKSEKNGIKLSVQDEEKVNEITKLHNDVTTRLAVTEDAYRQVKAVTGLDITQYTNLFKPISAIDIYDRPTQVTIQDQLDYTLLKGKTPLSTNAEEKTAYDRLVEKYGEDALLNLNHMFRKNGIDPKQYIKIGESANFKRSRELISEKFKKVNVVSDNFSSTLMGTDDELKLSKARLLPLFNSSRIEKDEQQAIAAVLTGTGGGITYDAHRPTKEGEPWTGTIFVTDKDGKPHSVGVDQKNLELITNRKFNAYVEDGLRARANVSQFGSTNLGAYTTDPNAYQSAAIKSGSFASLKDSDYTAFADITAPLSGGNLAIAIYAKDKTMSNFELIQMTPLKAKNVYFTDYNEIAGVIPRITPGMIKQGLIDAKKKK
jgi:hypothetical protein